MNQQPPWRGHRAPVEGPTGHPVPGRRPRPGRRWAVAVVVVLGIAAVVAGAVAAFVLNDRPAPQLPDVVVGSCLTSAELARGEEEVTELATVPCSGRHDAEVFALLRLQPGESLANAGVRCARDGSDQDLTASSLAARALEIRPLALDAEPAAGDPVACFVRRTDGAPLREAVVTTSGE